MTKSAELDGVAVFWGVTEVTDDVPLTKGDVPCFSLTENDCASETAESSSFSDQEELPKISFRSLRFVDGVLVRVSAPAEPPHSSGLHPKFHCLLGVHLALCFTLTAFLLLSFFCVLLTCLSLCYIVYKCISCICM